MNFGGYTKNFESTLDIAPKTITVDQFQQALYYLDNLTSDVPSLMNELDKDIAKRVKKYGVDQMVQAMTDNADAMHRFMIEWVKKFRYIDEADGIYPEEKPN